MVGYQSINATKNGYLLKTIQFEGINTHFRVTDITGNFEGVPYDDDSAFASTAPTLMVRNGDIYDVYYYLSDGVWDATIGDYGPGWCDQGGSELANDAGFYPSGTAVWFLDQKNETSTFTIAGAVLSDATSTTSFALGYTLTGNPFPMAVSFNDITFDGLVGVPYDDDSNFTATAPTMMIRNGDIYDVYYYLSDGVWDATIGDYGPGWCDQGGSELADYDAKLFTVATAFWVYLPDSGTPFSATFSK